MSKDGEASRAEPAASRRVLLAEDGLVAQRAAVGFLKIRGHDVVVANNGREAVEKYTDQAFDVVLMDLQMPELDGVEAAAAIRVLDSPSNRRARIIAMTASSEPDEMDRALAAGFDGYLAKPFHPDLLFQAVEELEPLVSPVEPAGESDVLDWDAACERMMQREELLIRLADSFLVESDQLMSDLRAAISQGDARAIRRAAHTLKGAADLFCATATVSAARQLELLGESGNLGNVEPSWLALEQQVLQLRQALQSRTAP